MQQQLAHAQEQLAGAQQQLADARQEAQHLRLQLQNSTADLDRLQVSLKSACKACAARRLQLLDLTASPFCIGICNQSDTSFSGQHCRKPL